MVTVTDGGSKTDYVVSGGFVEISPEGASVLAEEAVSKDEADSEWFAGKIKAEEEIHESATGDAKILSAQRIKDFRFLQSRLGA